MMIQSFKALKLKFEESSKHPHFIFIKEHSIRETSASKPPGRTLFILNIPPYADEQGIKNAFADAGPISSVLFYEKPSKETPSIPKNSFTSRESGTFRVAYVVFETVANLDKALKLESLKPLSSHEYKPKIGMMKWILNYNESIISSSDLKREINEFIENYDKVQLDDAQKEKELMDADDEGWTTVTKKGKVNSFGRTEKVENKILQKEEQGKKRKELQNFYTFQIRESKMKRIVALRQKFEEDKIKITQLKQTRRFKPF